jgi:hypothetical protein
MVKKMAKKILIQLDGNKYDVDTLKDILHLEFEDEFKFSFLHKEDALSVHDYAFSDFETNDDYLQAEKRIIDVLEIGQFEIGEKQDFIDFVKETIEPEARSDAKEAIAFWESEYKVKANFTMNNDEYFNL